MPANIAWSRGDLSIVVTCGSPEAVESCATVRRDEVRSRRHCFEDDPERGAVVGWQLASTRVFVGRHAHDSLTVDPAPSACLREGEYWVVVLDRPGAHRVTFHPDGPSFELDDAALRSLDWVRLTEETGTGWSSYPER